MMIQGAVISNCKKFRYELLRTWDETKPKVLFIMLNPSTADHEKDDRTIKKCIKFAETWNYGGLMVGNLYPFRATDPKDLFKNIGITNERHNKKNLEHIKAMKSKCKIVVYAWGIHGNKQNKGSNFIKQFPNGYYIELALDKTPKHPLYLKSNLKAKKYPK